MARVKIDSRSVEVRITGVVDHLRARNIAEHNAEDNGYAYACGYLQSVLERALNELPVGKRQKFLSDLEKQVQPKTRRVRNLMSGEMVEIAYDTPRSCDPSTELFWSM